MILKNYFTKYKVDVILDLVLIILGPFLKNINVDRFILITDIFKLL